MVKRIRNGKITTAETRTFKRFGNQENNLTLKERDIYIWEIKLSDTEERLSRDDFVFNLSNSSGADVNVQFIPSILGDEGIVRVKDLGGESPTEIKVEDFRSFFTQSKTRTLESFIDIDDDGIIRFITFEDLRVDEETGIVDKTQEIYLLFNDKENSNINGSYGGSIWYLKRLSRNVVLNSQGDSTNIIIRRESQIPVNAKFRVLEFDSLVLGFQNIIFGVGGNPIRVDELRGYDIIENDGVYEMVKSSTTKKKEWNPSINWPITTGSRNITIVNPWISELNWSKAIYDIVGKFSTDNSIEKTSDATLINLAMNEEGGNFAELIYQNTNKEVGDVLGGSEGFGNFWVETARFCVNSIWTSEFLGLIETTLRPGVPVQNPANSIQQQNFAIEGLYYNTSLLISYKNTNSSGWEFRNEDLDEFSAMILWGFNNEGSEPSPAFSGTKLLAGYKNNNGLSPFTSNFFVLKNTDNQRAGLNPWNNQIFLTNPRGFEGSSKLYIQDKIVRILNNEITEDTPANNKNSEESFSISEPTKNPNFNFGDVDYDIKTDTLIYPSGNSIAKINSDIINGLAANISGTSFNSIYYDIDTGVIKDIDESVFNVSNWPNLNDAKYILLTPERDLFNYYDTLIGYKNVEGIIAGDGNYTKQSGYVSSVWDYRIGADRRINYYRIDAPDTTSTQINRMERMMFDNTSSSPYSNGVVKIILRLDTQERWTEDDLIYIGSKQYKDTLLDENLNLAVDVDGKIIKPKVKQSVAFRKNNKRFVVDKEIYV